MLDVTLRVYRLALSARDQDALVIALQCFAFPLNELPEVDLADSGQLDVVYRLCDTEGDPLSRDIWRGRLRRCFIGLIPTEVEDSRLTDACKQWLRDHPLHEVRLGYPMYDDNGIETSQDLPLFSPGATE